MRVPADVATTHTLRFLERALPREARRVLEVGCGDGAVAAGLVERGLQVTAIDESPDAVNAARERGVAAVEADFLAYDGPAVDVVLFARVLHHLHPLAGAVARAAALLAPGGCVVVEDAALDAANRETARFRYDLEALLVGAGVMTPRDGGDDRGAQPVDLREEPLKRWRLDHEGDPPLHDGDAMLDVLRQHCALRWVGQAPYVYRYMLPRLEASGRGVQAARAAFEVESARVEEASIVPIGLRIVALGS